MAHQWSDRSLLHVWGWWIHHRRKCVNGKVYYTSISSALSLCSSKSRWCQNASLLLLPLPLPLLYHCRQPVVYKNKEENSRWPISTVALTEILFNCSPGLPVFMSILNFINGKKGKKQHDSKDFPRTAQWRSCLWVSTRQFSARPYRYWWTRLLAAPWRSLDPPRLSLCRRGILLPSVCAVMTKQGH